VEFRQVNVTEYPYEAIREAITNAVCHRDYLFSGATIRVMIFDDWIEVESPGKLPADITLENLDGSHVLRNKAIGELLHDIGYIEKWGTGIRRMKDLMGNHGLQEPEFEERNIFFRVTFHGPGDKILDLIRPEGEIDLKELGLNERQISALAMMVNEGKKFSNKGYRGLFNVSNQTFVRDMGLLKRLDLVAAEGRGRSLRYRAKSMS